MGSKVWPRLLLSSRPRKRFDEYRTCVSLVLTPHGQDLCSSQPFSAVARKPVSRQPLSNCLHKFRLSPPALTAQPATSFAIFLPPPQKCPHLYPSDGPIPLLRSAFHFSTVIKKRFSKPVNQAKHGLPEIQAQSHRHSWPASRRTNHRKTQALDRDSQRKIRARAGRACHAFALHKGAVQATSSTRFVGPQKKPFSFHKLTDFLPFHE